MLAAVCAVAFSAWVGNGRSSPVRERMRAGLKQVVARLPVIQTEPRLVQDPLMPTHPARLVGQRASAAGISAKLGSVPKTLLPKDQDREHKSPEARGGLNPCDSPDPGFGIYEKWRWGGGVGSLLIPVEQVRSKGSVNALFHFAGYELARKEVARSETPIAFVGVHFPAGGLSYRKNLSGPAGLRFLQAAASAALERVPEVPSKLDHIALGAWSAGYDGVGVLLQQSTNAEEVDAVVLLDGLHASRDDATAELQLGPFIRFAKRAARGEAFMFLSYSSVPTDGYASTHETSRRLIRALKGEPLFVERSDPGGLELKEMYSLGQFHARGYRGGGELDHCAHLLLYPMVLEALNRYWQSH